MDKREFNSKRAVSELIALEEVAEVLIKLSSEGNREEVIKLLKDKDFIDQMRKEFLTLFEIIILDIITFQNGYSILINSTEFIPVNIQLWSLFQSLRSLMNYCEGHYFNFNL